MRTEIEGAGEPFGEVEASAVMVLVGANDLHRSLGNWGGIRPGDRIKKIATTQSIGRGGPELGLAGGVVSVPSKKAPPVIGEGSWGKNQDGRDALYSIEESRPVGLASFGRI